MTTTTARRRIHPILLLVLLAMGLCSGCVLAIYLPVRIARGERAPRRDFTALDFFPPSSVYPANYEVVTPPRWAGPGTPLGVGDDQDAYATYSPIGKDFGYIRVIIFHESYWRFARERYEHETFFLDKREPPIEIAFQSERAQKSVVECSPNARLDDFGDSWQSCIYLARYDEFIVELWVGIGPEHLSWAEFESIIHALDGKAIDLLGEQPTSEP